jgi:hypothetical protein
VKLTAKATYIYVPKFSGNRELPEKEQVRVEIIRPKVEEREALFHFDFAQGEGADGMALKQRSDVGRALRRHVGNIENLFADYGGKEAEPVLTGKDLAEAPLFGAGGLATELFLEIVSDTLREDEKKTSAPPSS